MTSVLSLYVTKFRVFYMIFTPFLFSISLAYLMFTFYFFNLKQIGGSDYKAFIIGAKIILSGDRRDLYDIETQTKYQVEVFKDTQIILPFKTMPIIAILFSPFTLLSVNSGYKVFFIINVIAAFICAILLGKLFKVKKTKAIYSSFIFLPMVLTIIFAQIDIFLLILYLCVLFLLKKEKFFCAGLFSSFFFNKPHFVIFVIFIFLVSRKKKEFLLGIFSGLLAVFLFSISLVGLKGLLKYPDFILNSENPSYGADIAKMISLSSVLYHLFKTKFSVLTIYFINFVLLGIYMIYFYSKSKNKKLEPLVSSSVLASAAFLPHCWYQNLTMILPAYLYVISRIESPDTKNSKLLLYLIFILLSLIYYIGNRTSALLVPILLLTISVLLLNQESLDKLKFPKGLNFAKLKKVNIIN